MQYEGAIAAGERMVSAVDLRDPQFLIPAFDRLEPFTPNARILTENHVVAFNTRVMDARPFTLLRAQVLKKMRAAKWKLIGVTSATPEVGKSFVAANLAAALSRLSDVHTYLLDLDLRRASQSRTFGLEGSAGLTEYLAGENVRLSSIGRRVVSTNLALFSCFPSQVNSAELLVGPRFQALIGAMRALPDDAVVICDLPPVFANDDAMIVAQELDAFLFVVEEGVTTKKQVREAMRLLEPAPCLGTILNRYKGGMGDQYGYGYGMKYGSYYDA